MEKKDELEEIVDGCIRGKRAYQKKLFEMYYGKMMAVCYRYAKDKDEAQDMVQNGFIKVFKKLDVYNFDGSLEGWIRRIMVNTAIDQIRKNKRDPFLVDDDSLLQNEEEVQPFADADEFNLELKAETAIKAISELSPAYRTVFNMYVIEGFTHKEIANYLEISEGTSKSNLAKAKQKLRANLTEKFAKIEENE
ncbi:RNA polymerase sigma factor [Crocinitomix catalasitica]|uniref:RNA polymerase sigma factor n=1 Tax=Crocinitomix catalasitica TaxID=184607 RepID=UPI0004855B14|nr:RNA polymerase sigma factor [Crocinitomix catalasitica]